MSYSAKLNNNIIPFWRRIPRFFIFPASPGNLLRIVLLSALTALPFLAPTSMIFLPLLGGANFIAWTVFFRFAYYVLEMTSQGYMKPSDYPLNHRREADYKPYKQMLFFILVALMIGLAFSLLGKVLGFMYLVIAVLALPAGIIIISVEDSALAALNPLKALQIMLTIGWPYLVMYGFLFVLYTSQGLATQWVVNTHLPVYSEEFSPEEMGAFQQQLMKSLKWLVLNVSFVSMYFTIIMFNMIGYVLYQYHAELGLSVKVKQTGNSPESEVARLVATGNISAALDVAKEELDRNYSSIPANDRYMKLLLMSNFPDRTKTHARRFISLLISQKKVGKAVDVLESIWQVDPDFQITEAPEVLPIAYAAVAARKAKLAMRVMDKFDKRFPKNIETPAVYLYAAKLMSEEFNNYQQARRILQGILQTYRNHPVSAEAQDYLALLDKLEKV